MNVLAPHKQIDYPKIYSALIKNLAPTIPQNVPLKFFEGRMETFLTCLSLSAYLKKIIFDDKTGNFFEEVALNAVYKTLATSFKVADIKLLLSELPNILQLDYPVVKNLRSACVQIIPQLLMNFRANVRGYMPLMWQEYFYLSEQLRLLKI